MTVNQLPEELLQHRDFLHRLATSLMQDDHEGEDLVQEAWARAWQEPPRSRSDAQSLRAWLARVVRNRASNMRREHARRRMRERLAARPEALPAEHGIDDELALHGRVAAAVAALGEPYKRVVFEHYFRGRSRRDVAEELGVALKTVESRLARGRAQLQAALDADFGGRRAWLVFLAPIAKQSGRAGLGAGVLGMKWKLVSALVFVSVLVATWRYAGVGPAVAHEPLAVASSPALAAPSTAADLAEARTEPERVAGVRPEPDAATSEVVTHAPLRGRVLAPDGHALGSVRVRFDAHGSSREEAFTSATGEFAFDAASGTGVVRTAEPDLITVLRAEVDDNGARQGLTVVAAPSGSLSFDVRGEPVADAALVLYLPHDFRARFEQVLDRSRDVVFRARTAPDGSADIERAPLVVGCTVWITCAGYVARELTVDAAHLAQCAHGGVIALQLEELAEEERVLRGRVLDEFGDGVPGAYVRYGVRHTKTGSDGSFALDPLDRAPRRKGSWGGAANEEHDLVAVRAGYLPATLRPTLDWRGQPQWPDPIELQTDARSLAISGRVVDADGTALAGYSVFVKEAQLMESGKTLEGFLAGEGERLHATCSDDAGRFTLGGLLRRDYTIAAMDVKTLERGESTPVAAGAVDVRVVVAGDTWPTFAGTVVDHRGTPVSGVVVTPFADTQRARAVAGGWTQNQVRSSPFTTGADGRFELARFPRTGARLAVEHADVMHRYVDVAAARPEIEIVVSMRLRFQVVLSDPGEADALCILDASGQPMELYIQKGPLYNSGADPDIVDGRSRHMFVAEGAQTLVLLRDGVEVRRTPIELEPRSATELRF
ncbi:MAG: sigma-70 family RNA polymerase sigma factor [bacterium]|nr:sigma-70 family RNA polymerase sigma factor [bacterium]